MKANSSRKIYYVWEMPVRIFHMINAVCIFILAITGFIIGNPPAIMNSQEAIFGFWFGTVRFLHFSAGYVFFFNLLFRIYYSFVGNEYSRWNNFLPLTKKQWREIVDVIKIDILQMVEKPIISIGHNSLASFIYFLMVLVSLFQIVTGFGMLAPTSDWWLASLFSWIVPFMGSDISVRFWHHLNMWFFIIFTIIHVYLVAYHDYVEGRGVFSSIVGGWKFIRPESTHETE